MRAFAALAVSVAALVASAAPAAGAETGTNTSRYSLVHGCFALKAPGSGGFVKQAGDGYDTSGSVADAEPFRMQATDLGKYLFFGQAQDFLALEGGPLAGDSAIADTAPSPRADWTVDGSAGSFTIVNQAQNVALGIRSGEIVSVPVAQATSFQFVATEGCAVYPEIELNSSGTPNSGTPKYGEVEGTADGHMHMMAFEFLGRQAHCGEPWNKYGAPYALKDCVDHEASEGCGAVLETGLGGDPCHDTGGWPNFDGWPAPHSLTHESAYYRWLERAYNAGLRVYVNLMVENRVLCEAYPNIPVSDKEKSNCDEMDTVLREIKRIHELQDYIDAQEGGPGKGWFRIVKSPFKARRVINQGKLAVIQGMEVSEPFDCGYQGIFDPVPGTPTPDPRCSEEGIDDWLDRLHGLGLRQMEITNKFDNQLTGVAGDSGSQGVIVNAGQFLTNGTFWDFGPYIGTCDEHNHDRIPATGGTVSQDEIFGNGLSVFSQLPVLLPTYGTNDKCNQEGLTNLGKKAINSIIDRKIIFDPDHMSEFARGKALDLVEDRDYPGIISSHGWSTSSTLKRIYALGGMVTPYAGNATSFVHTYEELLADREFLGDQYFGVGYGADANGFGSQGDPRNPGTDTDVEYPFTGLDGAMTFDKQHSGTEAEGRTYDINTDGVTHYGMYADWLEDLRMIAGDGIAEDMNRGAEAYLQMWERAYGIREVDCSQWGDENLSLKGFGSELLLNRQPRYTLRHAGQPVEREKNWRWCAGDGGRNSQKAVFAGFAGAKSKMVYALSNLGIHFAKGVGPGDRAKALKRVGKKVSDRVWVSSTGGGRAYVWLADAGRVTHVGVLSGRVTGKPGAIARRLERVTSG